MKFATQKALDKLEAARISITDPITKFSVDLVPLSSARDILESFEVVLINEIEHQKTLVNKY